MANFLPPLTVRQLRVHRDSILTDPDSDAWLQPLLENWYSRYDGYALLRAEFGNDGAFRLNPVDVAILTGPNVPRRVMVSVVHATQPHGVYIQLDYYDRGFVALPHIITGEMVTQTPQGSETAFHPPTWLSSIDILVRKALADVVGGRFSRMWPTGPDPATGIANCKINSVYVTVEDTADIVPSPSDRRRAAMFIAVGLALLGGHEHDCPPLQHWQGSRPNPSSLADAVVGIFDKLLRSLENCTTEAEVNMVLADKVSVEAQEYCRADVRLYISGLNGGDEMDMRD